MADPLADDVFDRVFRTTRTFNHYTDQPVSEVMLRALWDLMKWGPTSANQSPARIVWCVSQESKDQLAACASGTNAAKIKAAPVTAIIAMDMAFYDQLPKLFPHTDARAWFVGNEKLIAESAFRNSTLQGAYFIIAARLLGLDTGPMSGFTPAAVNEAFFAGTQYRVNFISTLGYGDPEGLHPRLPRLDFDEANRIA
jgi:3-hydroxypropanoate dehydrogenase